MPRKAKDSFRPSYTKASLNSVEGISDVENISEKKSFRQFSGEMELVLATLSGAIDNLTKKPSNDIEKIFEWLEDWEWVAESDPGRAWSFDWCVDILALTRADYDSGKLREGIQKQAFGYERVRAMRERAIRGLASQKGASPMT